MNQDLFRQIIIEGQDVLRQPDLDLHPRDFEFEPNARYVFVGMRQAGKSCLLHLRALHLIEQGYDLTDMVFVNFDDERLIGMESKDLDLILQAYASMHPQKPVLFFDEIQNVPGWQNFARRLANLRYQIYITGSNAKMLSRDIATVLGGRFIEQRVWPYSFAEYAKAQGVELSAGWDCGNTATRLQRLMADYFVWGGFPELQLFVNKRKWLNSLYEKIMLADIMQRNNIRNEISLRLMMRKLAESITSPMSYNRLANLICSAGAKTTTASVIQYAQYLKDAFLVFSLSNYASKFVDRESIKKHYFTDNGLLSIMLTGNNAVLHENLCAIAAERHYHDQMMAQVYYYNHNVEVDFYCPDLGVGIQAAYTITDATTRQREVDALVALHRVHPLSEAKIVTYDERELIHADNLDIEVVPLWQWLIDLDK